MSIDVARNSGVWDSLARSELAQFPVPAPRVEHNHAPLLHLTVSRRSLR